MRRSPRVRFEEETAFSVSFWFFFIAVVAAECIIKCKQLLAREGLVSRGTPVVTEDLRDTMNEKPNVLYPQLASIIISVYIHKTDVF